MDTALLKVTELPIKKAAYFFMTMQYDRLKLMMLTQWEKGVVSCMAQRHEDALQKQVCICFCFRAFRSDERIEALQ